MAEMPNSCKNIIAEKKASIEASAGVYIVVMNQPT